MNWTICLTKNQAKPIKPDIDMAASLEETSKNKALSSEELELREATTASKISLYYDAVRELLEALALRKGYKIYNHICYTGFLKEILHQKSLAEQFDTLRKIRNDINYYGKQVSIDEAKKVLSDLKQLRAELLLLKT